MLLLWQCGTRIFMSCLHANSLPHSEFLSHTSTTTTTSNPTATTNVGNAVLADFAGPSTKVLDMGENPFVTDEGLRAIAGRAPSLAWVSLERSSDALRTSFEFVQSLRQLTDIGITGLVAACRQITHLDLQWCECVTDASLVAIGQSCPALSYLNLEGVGATTDIGVEALAKGCRALTVLKMRETDIVHGLSAFARKGTPLRTLSVAFSRRITEASLLSVAGGCMGTLSIVELAGVPSVSEAVIALFASRCRNLLCLGLRACPAVTEALLNTVRSRSPSLVVDH
jgi:F-box/leucine-rich repeat protein 2/20